MKTGKEDEKIFFERAKKLKELVPSAQNNMSATRSIVGVIPLKMFQYVMEGAEEGMEQISKEIQDLPPEEEVVENIKYMCETVTKKNYFRERWRKFCVQNWESNR